MKRSIKNWNFMVIALGVISLAGLAYNMFFYQRLRPIILAFGDAQPVLSSMEKVAAIWFILIFISHGLALAWVMINLRLFRKESLLLSLLLFAGLLSMLMVVGDFTLLSDIGKEYKQGWDTSGEWIILYISQGLHFLFWLLLIIMAAAAVPKGLKEAGQFIVKDESIFLNAQYMGVFCGLSGIIIFALLSAYMPLWALKKGIFIVSLLLLLPYLVIVAYWLIVKLKEKGREWYDEKQFQDICRAGLVSTVLSMVFMLTMYIIQYFTSTEFISVVWFPFYLFLILLIFSASTLYFAKRT
ncbi:MAG: hypothetical protein PHN32_08215 [Actinomycetota bacterium]|nr:hypothetical protein [Actinomycetota bacterium]